ncbi:nitrogen fixation NifU-like protein [Methylohalomonas lacus]|uniref:Nitrogen fixation NifU-like protein n=1 Tax=Methylohalomonas lacus TaxID=398773 RepID=A0AAE3HGX2_9GAMM|nr:SUF system NifU family Fe-S cluster assembly protein [Methylohalomonas lacus]MCS3902134.1 nitrogen fixation NifU-like protein [Methylohalomonas lacus]
MFDLKDLYQEVIVDHNRSPRNFGALEDADRVIEGYNPLCGDKLNLYVKFDDERISDVKFDGSGCAISVASASLMTEALKGKTKADAERIFNDFHELLTARDMPIAAEVEKLDKLAALAGVRDYPTRIKCATLCWHTLHSALEGKDEPVTTE